MSLTVSLVLAAAFAPALPLEDVPIRLPRDPAISADGQRIAFAWQGDVWIASVDGGEATRLTIHPANDASPFFSADGDQIYFTSNRSGRTQIHVMPASGGAATQITFDSGSKAIHGVAGDGKHLLVSMSGDRGWHYSESTRAYLLDVTGETPMRMLFDAGVRDAALSPDGTKVLFVRGRSAWNRKGYQGPQAAQMWLADLSTDPVTLTRLDEDRDYRLSGADLEARVVVTPWEAEAGTKVDVRAPAGLVTVSVPPGTRAGKRLRLRGQGFPDKGGVRGDCLVRIELDLPAQLTDRQKELLRQLADGAESPTGKGGAA